MPAYFVAEHIVTDDAKFLEFVTKARPVMAKHGGRYLTKTSTHKMPEGGIGSRIAFSSSSSPTWTRSMPSTTRLSFRRSPLFVSRAQVIKPCCSCLRVRKVSRSAAKLLTKDQARRIAANIAKLPVRMDQTKTEPQARRSGLFYSACLRDYRLVCSSTNTTE